MFLLPKRSLPVLLIACGSISVLLAQQPPASSSSGTVRSIAAPTVPLPAESESANARKFSFIAYGDTRGQVDGQELQPEHTRVIDAMLATIASEKAAGFPVRFVIQSGDAVTSGGVVDQWNLRFIPLIERLMHDGGVPYFFAVGNHDVGGAPAGSSEHDKIRNVSAAMANLWPPEGSPRRLNGYAAFSFGFGQFFFIAIDSNIVTDQTQLGWVTRQLETLDRVRYPYVIPYFHHPPITAGSHGGETVVEANSTAMRTIYLPLFRRHHARMSIAGHDHLLDHWVEHYEDETGIHRMDHLVSGGGGAPSYVYKGEPDLKLYESVAPHQHVRIEHLARPSADTVDNPHHFMLVEVDGDRLWVQAVATGAKPFLPYGKAKLELRDR